MPSLLIESTDSIINLMVRQNSCNKLSMFDVIIMEWWLICIS